MALKTKKEFADDCGIDSKHISTYAKRRLIVVREDGKIDNTNEVNYAFLIQKGFVETKKQQGTGKKPSVKKKSTAAYAKKPPVKKETVPKSEAKEPVKPKVPRKSAEQKRIEEETQRRVEELASMDRDKLEADTDKKRFDAEIARIKMEKLQGLLIPTDLVTSVIQLQAESLKKSYHDAAEKLIIIFCQKKKLNNKEMGELRRELNENVNDAIDSGIEESKKGIKRIVTDYAEVRGVGESM
jgi:hypothetical protein